MMSDYPAVLFADSRPRVRSDCDAYRIGNSFIYVKEPCGKIERGACAAKRDLPDCGIASQSGGRQAAP